MRLKWTMNGDDHATFVVRTLAEQRFAMRLPFWIASIEAMGAAGGLE